MISQQKTISVRTLDGTQRILASCIGAFGVHPQILRDGPLPERFSITHLPSGICFRRPFPTHEAAMAAAGEIAGLRDDWTTSFKPTLVDAEFIAALNAIYDRHGALPYLPAPDGEIRAKRARSEFAADLNGFGDGGS
jgi:hypothetical protein